MTQYVIHGGKPLNGHVTISGAKNAAVAILPAAVLVEGICRVENVPNISDVVLILDIMECMGAKVRRLGRNTVEIDSTGIYVTTTPHEMARKIRASYYFLGSLLGRFGRAQVAMPGGCDFGFRPIDQHIKGFELLGAQVETVGGNVIAHCDGPLQGATICLDVVSVGATMNIMIAAVLAEGTTVIENAAKEPHIVDLANFLNSMGAHVSGAGTDVIRIRGVKKLRGGTYSIIPDQIEAGTYLAAAVATGGRVTVENVIPRHLVCITSKLREMGAAVLEGDDWVAVCRTEPLRRANVKTLPYPGFPTDMQPQIVVCLSLAKGASVVTEGVYDNRYRYAAELRRLGADVQVDGKIAVVEGVGQLTGCPVKACDLRAGAALVIAGLAAQGTTTIEDVHYIERGYEDIIQKLQHIGADIQAVDLPEPPAVGAAG